MPEWFKESSEDSVCAATSSSQISYILVFVRHEVSGIQVARRVYGAKYRNCDENGTSQVEIRIFPFFFRCEVQELNCFRYFESGQSRFVGSLGCFSCHEDNVTLSTSSSRTRCDGCWMGD